MSSTKPQRAIVITGVTRGLGRALVDQCRQTDKLKTCRVFGCGRNAKKIEELNEQYGPQYVFACLSTSEYAAVMGWAAAVVKECGGRGPHLLINNAGLINENAPLWEVEQEEFQRVVDANIHGYYNVIKAFVPSMIANRTGVVVNVTSTWGRSTSSGVAPYCTTKFGQEGMALALSDDLAGTGVAAVSVNPGIIDTDMLETVFGSSAHHYWKPSEWAKVALPFFLQLDESDSGKQLSVLH